MRLRLPLPVPLMLPMLLLLANCAGPAAAVRAERPTPPFPDFPKITWPAASSHPEAQAYVADDLVEVRFHIAPETGQPVADVTTRMRAWVIRKGGEQAALLKVPYWGRFS